jgi:hypothetical protein
MQQNRIVKPPQSKSLALLPKPQIKIRLGGRAPSADMPPGEYLVRCEGAWIEPVGRNFRAVLEFRTVDGKFGDVSLRQWIVVSNGGGIVSPTGRYARFCEVALGRLLETDDPVSDPAQIFNGQFFLVSVGFRKTDGPRGGTASEENALRRKDDSDFLRVHEILAREELP